MPLARIITDSVDESLELTMQLRSRGFQVETCAPGNIPSTPADLEVRLEECNSEDVLMRTAQVSDSDDLWVFVAPGALDDSVRPIRTIPLVSAPITQRLEPKVSAIPASKFIPALIPNIAPEDDPIMLELSGLSAQSGAQAIAIPANGNGAHARSLPTMTSSIAVDLSPSLPERERPDVQSEKQKAEILEFPSMPQLSAHVTPPKRNVTDVGASGDLRFWRIACVTAVLAIASLLLGVNWSRTPEPSAVRHDAKALSKRSEAPKSLPTKPAAGARLGRGAPSPVAVARKAGDLRKPAVQRLAKSTSDTFVAKDTVTYFDRKGRPSPQKPLN